MKKVFKYAANAENGVIDLVNFEASEPRVVCGWCDEIIRPGAGPESHGICSDCLKEQLAFVKEMEPFNPKNKVDES